MESAEVAACAVGEERPGAADSYGNRGHGQHNQRQEDWTTVAAAALAVKPAARDKELERVVPTTSRRRAHQRDRSLATLGVMIPTL